MLLLVRAVAEEKVTRKIAAFSFFFFFLTLLSLYHYRLLLFPLLIALLCFHTTHFGCKVSIISFYNAGIIDQGAKNFLRALSQTELLISVLFSQL